MSDKPLRSLYNLGKDGWVFLGNIYQNELDQALGLYESKDEEIEDWAAAILTMDEICRSRNCIFVPVIVPSKTAVYEDKVMTAQASGPSPRTRIIAAARDHGYDLLDLRPRLQEARATADTYSRLNSHWTEYGGWIGWRCVAERLAAADPDLVLDEGLEVVGVAESDTMNEFHDLAGIEGVNNWTKPLFSNDPGQIVKVAMGGSTRREAVLAPVSLQEIPLNIANPNSKNDKTCLVLADSSVSSISALINYNFKYVYYRNHHWTDTGVPFNLNDTIAELRPDVVLYVSAERYSIFPLEVDGRSSAATRCAAAGGGFEFRWPPHHTVESLEFRGTAALSEPANLRLPGLDRFAGYEVAITFAAGERAQILVSYVIDGDVKQTWYNLREGLNTVFFHAPSDILGGNIWVLRSEARAPAVLTEIRVRGVPTEETLSAAAT